MLYDFRSLSPNSTLLLEEPGSGKNKNRQNLERMLVWAQNGAISTPS